MLDCLSLFRLFIHLQHLKWSFYPLWDEIVITNSSSENIISFSHPLSHCCVQQWHLCHYNVDQHWNWRAGKISDKYAWVVQHFRPWWLRKMKRKRNHLISAFCCNEKCRETCKTSNVHSLTPLLSEDKLKLVLTSQLKAWCSFANIPYKINTSSLAKQAVIQLFRANFKSVTFMEGFDLPYFN